jgi:DHA1 family inner membrane transport protein
MSEEPRWTRRRWAVLASLFVARFATSSPRIIVGLLLIEIAASFGSSVGVMGQIITVSSLVGMTAAFLMGAASMRFPHKTLLVLGLVFMTLSAVGCFLAPNYLLMLLFFAVAGLGGAIALPMTSTLVATHFAIEQRSHAMGWLVAGGALAVALGAPVVAWIGDWRGAFLGYVLPFSLLGFVLALTGVPSAPPQAVTKTKQYRESFHAILRNPSAVACLMGSALASASFQAVLLYASAFFRQRFDISTEVASLLVFGGAMCVTMGGIVSGRLVNRVGRKRLTVAVGGLLGVFIAAYTTMPDLWFATAARFVASWLAGMTFSASASLSLEQLPPFRGTMMSLNTAMQSVGNALGAGLGGLALLIYDYEAVGISLGALAVIGTILFHLLAVDPIASKA